MRCLPLAGAAGAAGQLGQLLASVSPEQRPADMALDLAAMDHVGESAEGIVRLGGRSGEGPPPAILHANIIGRYNLFEAARRRDVKRVACASSPMRWASIRVTGGQ